MCIWKCYVFAGKTLTKRMESQRVQRSKWGVSFVFKCMMKSLPKVARTEVLHRNILEDWSVKDRTSCEKTLYLGCEDHVIKLTQLEGAKCKMLRGPTVAKGRPNRARIGLGRRPALPIPMSVRPHPPSWAWRRCNPKVVEAPPFTGSTLILRLNQETVHDFILPFLPPCGPHLTPLATWSLERSLLVFSTPGGLTGNDLLHLLFTCTNASQATTCTYNT
jgi:hypothetical protein